eukprot:gene9857-18442_t
MPMARNELKTQLWCIVPLMSQRRLQNPICMTGIHDQLGDDESIEEQWWSDTRKRYFGIYSPVMDQNRLTDLANFQMTLTENFCYELTLEPMSLFKQGMMRKSAKAVLRNHLLATENAIIPTTNDVCVFDGDALLHKVHWPNQRILKFLNSTLHL